MKCQILVKNKQKIPRQTEKLTNKRNENKQSDNFDNRFQQQ